MTGVETFRNVPCVDGRDDEIRCKSPVAVDAKDGTVLTDMGVAFLATRAIPASEVALDGDQVATLWVETPSPTATTVPLVSWPVTVPKGTLSRLHSSHFQM